MTNKNVKDMIAWVLIGKAVQIIHHLRGLNNLTLAEVKVELTNNLTSTVKIWAGSLISSAHCLVI